jgi:hypothetical protein
LLTPPAIFEYLLSEFSERELKLTAALYAQMKDVLKHVRATGKLPQKMWHGGAEIGMRLLIERRGTDIKLTAEEKLVYNAILRCKRLPAGRVLLTDEKKERSGEARQTTRNKAVTAKKLSYKSKAPKKSERD